MPSGKGTYWANKALDEALGGVDFTPPPTLYIALYTAAPSAGGGGTEVSGGSYARVAVTNDLTHWPSASGGSKSNALTITFPTATADWGTVVAVAIMDASSGGNELYFGSLTQSKVVSNGDTAQFAASALTVTET
jgi:hypothetical protein